MKNVKCTVSAVLSLIFLAGCDGATTGVSALTINNPGAATAGSINCTATPNGSGGVITTCNNGITVTSDAATVAMTKGIAGAVGAAGAAGAAGLAGNNGSAGAAGAQGPQGVAGTNGAAAPTFVLKDANNNQIGTHIVAYNSGVNVTVWDATSQTMVTYLFNGQQGNGAILYYPTNNCSGNAYAAKQIAQNTMTFGGSVTAMYTVSQTALTFAPASSSSGPGNCTVGASANAIYSQVVPFTPTTAVPALVTLPMRMLLQ